MKSAILLTLFNNKQWDAKDTIVVELKTWTNTHKITVDYIPILYKIGGINVFALNEYDLIVLRLSMDKLDIKRKFGWQDFLMKLKLHEAHHRFADPVESLLGHDSRQNNWNSKFPNVRFP